MHVNMYMQYLFTQINMLQDPEIQRYAAAGNY